MYVRFDANLANALINGQPLPVQFVHEFVQNAYEAFQYAQQTHASNTEKDARIKQLEGEISVVKAALLDAEQELNQAQEKLHSIYEHEYQNKLSEAYDK